MRRYHQQQPCDCNTCLSIIDAALEARIALSAFRALRPRYPFFTLPSYFSPWKPKNTRRLTRPLGGVPTVTMPTDVTAASGK